MNVNGLLGSLLSPTSSGSAPLALPPRPAQNDKAQKGGDPSNGVMAEISDAARSLWAQMQTSGVTDASFDLHLDLRQLGMKVDASGNHSIEGRGLTVDLHVEAHQGSLKTSDGQDAAFSSLDVSYSLEEVDMKATEQSDQSGDPQPAQQKYGSLIDGLKKLVDMLDKSNGQPQDAQGLGDLLSQIGRALQEMANRVADKLKPGAPGSDEQAQAQTQQYQEDVHIHAVHIQMTAVQDAQTQAA